jgi:hypothetical protein
LWWYSAAICWGAEQILVLHEIWGSHRGVAEYSVLWDVTFLRWVNKSRRLKMIAILHLQGQEGEGRGSTVLRVNHIDMDITILWNVGKAVLTQRQSVICLETRIIWVERPMWFMILSRGQENSRNSSLTVNAMNDWQLTFCPPISCAAFVPLVSLIHSIHDRYGASGRQMEDDIWRILPVPCTTELHHDSGHCLFREGLVPITACYHTTVCAALRTLVVSLLEPNFSTQISRGRHIVLHSTNERHYPRNFALVSHEDGLTKGWNQFRFRAVIILF